MFLIHQPDDNGDPSVYPQFNTIEKNLGTAAAAVVVAARETSRSQVSLTLSDSRAGLSASTN
eukprot:COSAG02_NODE_35556_length_466_cov_1.258856_1_plen_61_part_10